MEIEKFIANFVDQLDEIDANIINADTNFRDLDEWDSLTSLSVIAMVDEEYNVKLTGDDFRNSTTVQDLFDIVKSRTN